MAALFRQTSAVAFDGLYRHHAAAVYRYVYAVVGNRADAEDITQQTFLNAYRAMEKGTKPRKAENWLLTIAHNEVRRHFRTTQGRPLEVELDEHLARPAPERSEPSVADVLRALQRIPPAQRSALVMREFEGRSYAEMAKIMNVTEKALETLIFRARRSLAEQLEGTLTCAEAEEAFLRRMDGRLPRREARRLKAHVKDCLRCARFRHVQKRQRSLLKGLSVMPVPASVLLFRGEMAAAAGGSAAVGAGGAAAGAGATGIATGLVAKAAAVTAAAAVAGGVGYEVAVSPDPVTKAEPTAHLAEGAREPERRRAVDAQATRPVVAPTVASRPAYVKAPKPKGKAAKARPSVRKVGRAKIAAPSQSAKAHEKAPRVAAHVVKALAPKPKSSKTKAATKPLVTKAPRRPKGTRAVGRDRGRTTPAAAKIPRPAKAPPPVSVDEREAKTPPSTAKPDRA